MIKPAPKRGRRLIVLLAAALFGLAASAWPFWSGLVRTVQPALAASLQDDATVSSSPVVTHTLYMPAVGRYYPRPTRSLGTTQFFSGPTPCDGQTCYQIRITCPEVANQARVEIKVADPPPTVTLQGTIVFATGWIGDTYWDKRGGDSARAVSELRSAGYRTVQFRWVNNWFFATSGSPENFTRLGCRPATAIKWVYDNLHTQTTPYCAAGWSNGASQIAIPLVDYDLHTILDTALFESGPNWARVDQACIQDEPAYAALFMTNPERNTTDWAFGFPNNGTGACATKNPAYRADFQEGSLAYGVDLNIPNTKIGFLFGALDTTTTANHGAFFYDSLIDAGVSGVISATVAGADHDLAVSAAGANAVRDFMLSNCP